MMLSPRTHSRKKSPLIVKSAARVLEVVEYVSQVSRGVTATELMREFGYPASSTSALLKSLCALGYLFFDRPQRTYHATASVALIGLRTMPHLFGDGQLLKVMEEVNRQTGESVILAMEVDSQVRFIHKIDGPGKERLHLRSQGLRSLVTCCSGRLFLSTLTDANIRAIAHRHNCQLGSREGRLSIDTLLDEIQQIRAQGYCVLISQYRPGIAGVAMLVPQQGSGAQLAIVIAGSVSGVVANHRDYAHAIDTALSKQTITGHRIMAH